MNEKIVSSFVKIGIVYTLNVGICLGAMVLTLILYRNNVLRISVIVLSTLIVIACGIKNRNRLREYLRK